MLPSGKTREVGENKDPNLIDLALPDGQCAQRFFVRRIYRNAEFVFHLLDGGERTGYVTGFDNLTIQISTSETMDPTAVLIPWAAVMDIEETGKTLESKYPQAPEFQDRIKAYTSAIRAQAQWNLSGKTRPQRVEDPTQP